MTMSVPEYLQNIVHETLCVENEAAHRCNHWAVILGLAPVQDGDHFGIVWGSLPTGVAGFGKTPLEAIRNFDAEMEKAATRVPAQVPGNG